MKKQSVLQLRFFTSIHLFLFFSFFVFFPKNMLTDPSKRVEQEYSEYVDLGNGMGIAIQKNGYFIEDENGNVFYTEKSKTQFLEHPAWLEGKINVVYEENSCSEEYILAEKSRPEVSVGGPPVGTPTIEEEQTIAAHRYNFRREFSRDVSRVFGAIASFNAWNSVPHSVDEIPTYIGQRNSYYPGKKNKFIQKFSMYECRDGKTTSRKTAAREICQSSCFGATGKQKDSAGKKPKRSGC